MTPPAEGHRRFEEDLAAYLLGSLEQGDRIALEAHLDQCERCRTDLDWLRPTVGVLATSVPQLEPPRRLRRRTLTAARQRERTSEPPRRSAVRIELPRVATVGAAVALVALAVAIPLISLSDDSGSGSTTVPVQAADARTEIGGNLIVSDDAATLEVARMPRLPASQVYEAWVERDGEIEPSSTFIVDRNGAGAATIPDVEGADRVMVTREPRGGSHRPTTAPLLEVPL